MDDVLLDIADGIATLTRDRPAAPNAPDGASEDRPRRHR
jgi:hypothetical protein